MKRNRYALILILPLVVSLFLSVSFLPFASATTGTFGNTNTGASQWGGSLNGYGVYSKFTLTEDATDLSIYIYVAVADETTKGAIFSHNSGNDLPETKNNGK